MLEVSWHHTSLAVNDLDRALEFYREAFGFELLFEARGMTSEIRSMTGAAELSCDLAQLILPGSEQVLELIAFAAGHLPPESAAPLQVGAGHIAFSVPDLETALDEAKTLGATLLGEITTFSEGRSAYCREPAGSVFELTEFFEEVADD